MPASYLHGVEVIETIIGTQTVQVVKSAVIGLVGVAPPWVPFNANPTAVVPPGNSANTSFGVRDDAQWGPLVEGWSLPDALYKIHLQGSGQCLVVNVFNWTAHSTSVSDQAGTFNANGQINLGKMFVSLTSSLGTPDVLVQSTGGGTTYEATRDYILDPNNGFMFWVSTGTIPQGGTVQISFSYADPTKVVAADLVGTVASQVFTGLQAFLPTYSNFGFFPKIIQVPNWMNNEAVTAAVLAICNQLRAVSFWDEAPGTSVQTAISDRSNPSSVMDEASTRVYLCYPNAVWYDLSILPAETTIGPGGLPIYTYANAPTVVPLSTFFAGAQSNKDLIKGYWYSVSNTLINGILGGDVDLYASILDPDCDTNNLNGEGIGTIFAAVPGQLVWGNRSSAFPIYTTPDTFLCVRRTADVVEESLELAMMADLDQPLSNAYITYVVQQGNAFIHSLIARGALLPGSSVSYNPDDNPTSELAAGHVTFEVDMLPPPPAERITFNVFLDTNLLSSLGTTTATTAVQTPAS